MANSNQIELVVTVEVDKANQSIKSVNANLSGMEAAASKSARAASSGIDGMTASMVKGATAGTLLADTIKKAVEWVKAWTIEAAKAAAHEARMESSGRALARAHGIAAESFEKAVEAVRKIGYHGEDAVHTIDRLMIADIGLEKAEGLAKVAKDAAAIENIAAPEALEKILQSIEFGNARALRAAGLRVDFEKQLQIEELKLGRTLTDNEKVQLRYNAVTKAATAIQGAHAGAAGEAEMQQKKLALEMQELREAVGAEFQDAFKQVIQVLRDMVGWLKENTSLLVKFGQGAMTVAGLLATYALATKILSVAKAVTTLNLALAANPWALALTGIAAGGAIIYSTWKDTEAGLEAKGREAGLAGIRNQIAGGTSLADLKKRGISEDDMRAAIFGDRGIGGSDLGGLGEGFPKVKIVGAGAGTGAGEPTIEQLKLAVALRKQQIDNEKFFRGRAAEAGAVGKTGYAKDVADLNATIAKQTTYTDDKGIQHYVALTRAAWNSILTELQAKWAAFKDKTADDNRKNLAEYLKGEQDAHQKVMDFEAERFQRRLAHDVDIAQRNMSHVEDLYRVEEARAGYERDAALRQIEGGDAVTLQQKAAIEQRKAEIEITYLEKVHEVRDKLYDIDTQRMLLEEELTMKRLGYRADEIKPRIDELKGQREEIKSANDEETNAAVQAARENAANRTAQMVRDQNQKIFDSLKQQAGGVFDALLSKSQSVWQSIANSFKTAVLTAIKEVVTSRVAAALMALLGGGRAAFASGGGGGGGAAGGGGILGGILGGGLFGGGGGGGGLFGGGGGNPMILSAGGGTGAGGSGGGGGILGLLGGGKGFGSSLAGLKSFLGFGGGVQYAPGHATTWAASTMGQKLSALGRSDAAGIAGGLLAFDGLRRGGLFGMGETTAGGAMIGFRYGGPIGAAIGGAIGLAAGIGRLFIHGATEKAREKIKKLYGVDISDKGILKQIVDTVKQSFGGNLDVGLRSPQIREIVQLYAMSTGKPVSGMPATMQSLTMQQSGGSLYSMPNYSNGTAMGALDTIGRGVASGAGGGTVVIPLQIDSKTVGTAVVSNGRVVTQGAINGLKANAGRRQLTALQLSPGLITA